MAITQRASGTNKRQSDTGRLKKDEVSPPPLRHLSVARMMLLISLLSVLAYANSLGGDFVYDDTDQIVENQDIRSWDNLGKAFTTHVWAFREREGTVGVPPPLPYYRPLFTAMLTIEYHLFGLWPQGWHLVSLLLHVLCAIGVFYVVLLMSGRRLAASFTSVIFAVHPVHSESVAWISGMTDPLFGVFFLASFYFYLRARAAEAEARATQVAQRYSSSRFLLLSLAMFMTATFAKETALSLALLILGYEFVSTSGAPAQRITLSVKRALPYAGVALIYLMPRYLVLGDFMWRNPQAPYRPLAHTLLTLPVVLCSYTLHLLWPIQLSVTYNTHFVTGIASAKFLLPVAMLSLIAIALFVSRRKIGPDVWKALLLMFVPLLPVLNLGQISREEYLVFDHYLYLPVAGLGYLIAIGIAKLGAFESSATQTAILGLRRPALALAVFAVIALGLTTAAARENRPWADSYSLWSNVARVRPEYWAGHYNAGLALLDSKRFGEARASLERAAALKPNEPDVADALGRAYDGIGDTADAVASFKRAIEIDPEMFESYNNLGAVYFKNENYDAAETNFAAALRLKPEASASRFNLGLCYARKGRYSDAARELERVVQGKPDDAAALYELGLAYERLERTNDAARVYGQGRAVAKSGELADKMSESLSRLRSRGAGRQ